MSKTNENEIYKYPDFLFERVYLDRNQLICTITALWRSCKTSYQLPSIYSSSFFLKSHTFFAP